MIDVLFKDNMELECIIRMVCALLSGFALGLERSKHGKAAGIRTYMLVAIGACIFAFASKYGFADCLGARKQVDIARISANIVTGVSFLGAGTIYVRSDRVTGVNTAAGIWVMAAIGTTFGLGMYKIALIATLYMIGIQVVFQGTMTRHMNVKVPEKIDIIMDSSEKSLNKVLKVFEDYDMEIETTSIKRHKGDFLQYSFEVNMPESLPVIDVVNAVSSFKNVQSVDM